MMYKHYYPGSCFAFWQYRDEVRLGMLYCVATAPIFCFSTTTALTAFFKTSSSVTPFSLFHLYVRILLRCYYSKKSWFSVILYLFSLYWNVWFLFHSYSTIFIFLVFILFAYYFIHIYGIYFTHILFIFFVIILFLFYFIQIFGFISFIFYLFRFLFYSCFILFIFLVLI